MITSIKPRKAHDSLDSSIRQSLPSISEVISRAKLHASYPLLAPNSIQPLPLSYFPLTRPTPPSKHQVLPSHMHELHKSQDAHLLSGSCSYDYVQPPSSKASGASYQPEQRPPGQVLLPEYPSPPRHVVPQVPGGYDPKGPPPPPLPHHVEEAELKTQTRYDGCFESCSYRDSLGRVCCNLFIV